MLVQASASKPSQDSLYPTVFVSGRLINDEVDTKAVASISMHTDKDGIILFFFGLEDLQKFSDDVVSCVKKLVAESEE